jgi:hypothetical protein
LTPLFLNIFKLKAVLTPVLHGDQQSVLRSSQFITSATAPVMRLPQRSSMHAVAKTKILASAGNQTFACSPFSHKEIYFRAQKSNNLINSRQHSPMNEFMSMHET